MRESTSTIIPRETYLSKLRAARGLDVIKGLTGIRRCGKSTLLLAFMDELKAEGVPEDRMLYVNLEESDLGIRTCDDILDLVSKNLSSIPGSYVFLDEVQTIPNWEIAVSTLFIKKADIYVTGSNSQMLSSELSTRLSGRCLEIRVRPLTFSEYVKFRNPGKSRDDLFAEYIRRGGFPAVARMEDTIPDLTNDMLSGIYNTVYTKDVTDRHSIRNTSAISNLCRFLMKNIGDRTSVRSATNYLSSSGLKVRPETIDSYISMLEGAMLFERAKRKDSKSKDYLRTNDKFYATDIGLRNIMIPYSETDLDGILENIVFNELSVRYGTASTCSVGQYEVDFVTGPINAIMYWQVCLSLADPETLKRELRPLRAIDDNFPKTIITLDKYPADNIDGIRIVRITDWLLGD